MISELGNGGIDVAIVPETQTYRGLRFSPLREEPQSLYCGASHPLFRASPSKIDAKTVAQYPFAIRPYAKGFELQHVPGAIAKTAVSSMEAQAMLVLSGLYLSYLPEHYAKAWVKSGEMRSLCRKSPASSPNSSWPPEPKSDRHQSWISYSGIDLAGIGKVTSIERPAAETSETASAEKFRIASLKPDQIW